MKITNYLTLFISLFYLNNLAATELAEKAVSKNANEAQIKLIKKELEFLATKLLKMTGEGQYTISHEGHERTIFGACGDATAQGIKISCVTPQSTAFRMGLKTGDTITMFNNIDLKSSKLESKYELYSNSIKQLKNGDKVTILFERAGNIKKVTNVYESFYSPEYVFSVAGRPKK